MTQIKFMKRFEELFGLNIQKEREMFADVKFKKLDERAVIPTYAHDGDIGMDLTAIDLEYDAKNDTYIYHTGLALETDKHYGVFLFPRSSNRKTECYLANHVGIVDSFLYRGEIMLCFKNRTSIQDKTSIQHLQDVISNLLKCIRNSNSLKKLQDKLHENKVETNLNPLDFAPYNVGDRVAQMVVFEVPPTKSFTVDELSETERGEGGFGSTGK